MRIKNNLIQITGLELNEYLKTAKGTKVKFNKSIRNQIELEITRNNGNEQVMMRYLKEIIVGIKSGKLIYDEIKDGAYIINYSYIVWNSKEKKKKEYLIKNKVTEDKIYRSTKFIRNIEKQEESSLPEKMEGLTFLLIEVVVLAIID